ncbi:uncharacterized protein LOC120282836 [Dioscorea cayenensis subsp. rotundata]|uniref:Uncharacterized protein LOC120282836 n=1 Tax=Dioscorea cayennensis subsp. rotundata TaxID=55577 RepID=A0AB40CZR8_DIOCR|nr:uncharacterized protein LOC120282836 [Dioscorea cayenensis subsp. rotundata]
MAANGSGSSQVNVPPFNGDGYNLWSLKMETILLSRDLWGMVEKGYNEEEEDEHKRTENTKRNAKALCLIQQALDAKVLIRISQTRNAKKAWDILKGEYQGCAKNAAAQLHSHRQDFENTRMKHGEKIQDYISRVLTVVYHIRALGEELSDPAVVGKILRSLSSRFNHVVSSIIESKDLSSLTIEELSGSLRGHEGRLDVDQDHMEEKGLYIKGATFQGGRGGRGRGRGSYRGRGRGRGWNSDQGQGRWSPDQSQGRTSESSKQNKGVQCYACKNFGHIKS